MTFAILPVEYTKQQDIQAIDFFSFTHESMQLHGYGATKCRVLRKLQKHPSRHFPVLDSFSCEMDLLNRSSLILLLCLPCRSELGSPPAEMVLKGRLTGQPLKVYNLFPCPLLASVLFALPSVQLKFHF